MEIETILTFFSGSSLLYSIYLIYKEKNSNSWPKTLGHVVELEPQTTFERSSPGQYILNIDTDHYLIWNVAGKEYRKRIADKASVEIMYIKVWRKSAKVGEVEISYNPNDPSSCFTADEKWGWVVPAVLSLGLGLGAVYAAVA